MTNAEILCVLFLPVSFSASFFLRNYHRNYQGCLNMISFVDSGSNKCRKQLSETLVVLKKKNCKGLTQCVSALSESALSIVRALWIARDSLSVWALWVRALWASWVCHVSIRQHTVYMGLRIGFYFKNKELKKKNGVHGITDWVFKNKEFFQERKK